MFEKLRNILSKVDADYGDIRYEIKKVTTVSFNGKELTQIGSNSTDGFVIRVVKGKGMASAVFTKEENAEDVIKRATENACLIGKNRKQPVELAKAEITKDTFKPPLKEDPRTIDISEKLELTREYNNIPLSHENIATTLLTYQDIVREKYFVSTEGTHINEDLITTRLTGEIIAGDGTITQNVRVHAGGSNGFSEIRNQEQHLEERTAIALDLLKAEPVKGGMYTCILNQSMAGVFTHEAFGHYSEADIIESLPSMREKMKIGNTLGSKVVNIVDDPTLPDQLGFYRYDDEGVMARRVQLMKHGVLTGRLHSRRTAHEFNEPSSGHAVAEDYRYAPIIRMGTIFIQPDTTRFEDLLEMLGDGLYILDAKGGQTAGENFTFGAQYGYVIRKGKKDKMIRDINISGNLYKTLNDITAVADDLVLSKVGGCGKGQINIRSCHGAPHILVKNLVVGGA